ncbi:hypothetical protein GW17_00013224 [Ensete ventricosum]|nr:hypothetical protein GW17_00013224 [Ensete ventricosum]
MDEKSSKALEVMLKEHDEDSIITKSSLPKIRATYRILGDFYIHIHGVGQHPFDPFLNGFNLSVDALEAGVRFPLHPLVISLCDALAYFVGVNLMGMKKLIVARAPCPKISRVATEPAIE